MKTTRFLSGPAAQPWQRGGFGLTPSVAAPPGTHGQVRACAGTASREASADPRTDCSGGQAVFHAFARWLLHALAESARAWALAAGVSPDLYENRAAQMHSQLPEAGARIVSTFPPTPPSGAAAGVRSDGWA
jgi:hypothetical protein